MQIEISRKKDGVYDVYDKASRRWLFSTVAPDNVLARLSQMPCIEIDFINETIPEKLRDGYCASTGRICSFCQPGPCEHRTM